MRTVHGVSPPSASRRRVRRGCRQRRVAPSAAASAAASPVASEWLSIGVSKPLSPVGRRLHAGLIGDEDRRHARRSAPTTRRSRRTTSRRPRASSESVGGRRPDQRRGLRGRDRVAIADAARLRPGQVTWVAGRRSTTHPARRQGLRHRPRPRSRSRQERARRSTCRTATSTSARRSSASPTAPIARSRAWRRSRTSSWARRSARRAWPTSPTSSSRRPTRPSTTRTTRPSRPLGQADRRRRRRPADGLLHHRRPARERRDRRLPADGRPGGEHFSVLLDKDSPLTACVNEAIAGTQGRGTLAGASRTNGSGPGARRSSRHSHRPTGYRPVVTADPRPARPRDARRPGPSRGSRAARHAAERGQARRALARRGAQHGRRLRRARAGHRQLAGLAGRPGELLRRRDLRRRRCRTRSRPSGSTSSCS